MMDVTIAKFRICAIELRLRVESYESQRLTFWLVPAKRNCLGFISGPCQLLGIVEMGPGQFNRSVKCGV